MNLSLSQIHSCINKCLTSQMVLKIIAPGNMWKFCKRICPPSLTLLSGSHFALKCIFLLQTLLCPALLDNRANCPFTWVGRPEGMSSHCTNIIWKTRLYCGNPLITNCHRTVYLWFDQIYEGLVDQDDRAVYSSWQRTKVQISYRLSSLM